jgi:hypothetical protein
MARYRLRSAAALVAAGVLFAGACGGDDDDDGAGSERRSDETSEDARAEDDATTTTASDSAADDGAVDSAGDSDSPDAGTSADDIGEMDFCDGFRTAIRLDSETALDGARQLEPPDEIADDWEVFLDFAESSLSTDPADPSEDVAAVGAAAEEATTNILDYVGQECGYTVDPYTGEVSDG